MLLRALKGHVVIFLVLSGDFGKWFLALEVAFVFSEVKPPESLFCQI